jgi:hypothetical protein
LKKKRKKTLPLRDADVVTAVLFLLFLVLFLAKPLLLPLLPPERQPAAPHRDELSPLPVVPEAINSKTSIQNDVQPAVAPRAKKGLARPCADPKERASGLRGGLGQVEGCGARPRVRHLEQKTSFLHVLLLQPCQSTHPNTKKHVSYRDRLQDEPSPSNAVP